MARIEPFLDQYTKPSTRSSYRGGVYAFLTSLYGFERKGKRISDEEKVIAESLADKYFLEDRNYEQDLIQFHKYCDKNFAPTTGAYYITAIKEFFSFNDIELTVKQTKNLKNKIKRGGPISVEADLNRETIRQLLNNSDLKLKTLITFIINSGARLGEVLDLNLSDVKIHEGYGAVTIRKAKNKYTRTTFIGPEAVELLNQWLLHRDEYLKYIIRKSRGRFRVKTPSKDKRLFPINKNSAEMNIKTALKKAGLMEKDRETGRSTIHYHGFRKYFITQMDYSGVPGKFLDYFAGHFNDIDRAYFKPSQKQLLETYQKGEPYLRIYSQDFEEIAKQKELIKETKDRVRDLQVEHLMSKSKLGDAEKEIEQLKREKIEADTRLTDLEMTVKALKILAEYERKNRHKKGVGN